MGSVVDRRVELEREIEFCNRQQHRLAERASGRVFTPQESRDWSALQERRAVARRELEVDPTRRL